MKFFSPKFLLSVGLADKNRILSLLLDPFVYNKDIISDYKNKSSILFFTKQPFFMGFRLNYAYDVFVISMHYSLFLTSYFFFLTFGSGLK